MKVRFVTLGCKVNQYETQRMREIFLSAGFEEAGRGTPAGVCVINTCTVTAKADSDSLYAIRRAVEDNPGALVLATGCLAEKDGDRIKKIKGVSSVLRNACKERILDFVPVPAAGSIPAGISFFYGRSRAFVKIQDGCDNRCSYCKVSLVRGRIRSRGGKDILEEISRLAANGYREIVLTGICLGSYGIDKGLPGSLAQLIKDIARVDGLDRIRLSSIEVSDISPALLELFSEDNKLCPHFHVPLQSGDDRILAMMRRRYNGKTFLERIGQIKKSVPGVSITTDVIAGFPGEDEKAFLNTLRTIREIQPLKTHVFPFSPRKGTAAAEMTGRLSRETIKRRCVVLSGLARECSIEYMKSFIDKEVEVMPEGGSPDTDNKKAFREGYSSNYIRVMFPCAASFPQDAVLRVKLKEITGDSMRGEVTGTPAGQPSAVKIIHNTQ